MRDSKTWDANHDRVGATDNFVTSTPFSEIAKYHEIETPHDMRVMEIGVGDGQATRDLAALNNEVVAIDISEVALAKVRECAYESYLTEYLATAYPVDLAFCHLVMQHNDQYEVARIINDVPLKPEGMLSFQFASLNPEKTKLPPQILRDINECMLHYYSPSKIVEIVANTNKRIDKIIGPRWFQEASFDWYIVHAVNR